MTSTECSLAFAFFLGAMACAFGILLACCVRRKFFRTPFVAMSAGSKMVLLRGKWISIEEYLTTELGIPVSHVMTEADRNEALRAFQEDVAHNGIPRPATECENAPEARGGTNGA